MSSYLEREVIESLWDKVIAEIGIETAELLSASYDPARRTYGTDKHVYKIVLLEYETTNELRTQDIQGEYDILRSCSDIPGVPSAIRWKHAECFDVIVLERVSGEHIKNLDVLALLTVLRKLSLILYRLAYRGISHNDVKYGNVFLNRAGEVSLIDFDQATHTNFLSGIVRSFFGIKMGGARVHGSLMTIIKDNLKERLSPKTINILKKYLGKGVNSNLPTLSENATESTKILLEAWRQAQISDASSPGVEVAYYSFNFEGYMFPGERPWEDRWNVIRSITNYSGKRVLELGCNMSLLSCFLLKEENAASALCVDVDENILEVAKLVASALGVEPEYRQQNFNSPSDWETGLAETKPEIVFALNVLNWVNDKDRFMNFLGRFDEVIFEGHDSALVESERFRIRGYSDIKLIGTSERERPLLHCRK